MMDLWFVADEVVGVALGLLVVVCLIFQRLLAWPLGVAYVLVTLPQLWQAQLYANFVLHLVGFLPLNLYGWYHWLFGGDRPVGGVAGGEAKAAAGVASGTAAAGAAGGEAKTVAGAAGGEEDGGNELPVRRAPAATLLTLAVLCILGGATLGWSMASREALDFLEAAAARAGLSIAIADAAFPYWDNGVLVMSLAAMWLTARKLIENWLVWVAVNLVSVPLYYAQDLPWYALLYCVYIPMAVWGYVAWLRSMNERA